MLSAVLSLLVVADAPAPLRVDLSQTGLNYIVTVATPILQQKVASIHIPDISGQSQSFDYSLTSM